MNFSGLAKDGVLELLDVLKLRLAEELALASMSRPPRYWSRQRPMGSKLSSTNPSGSMRA